MLAVTTTTYPIGAAGVLTLEQRTFHGSARGATDATGTTLWPTALPLLMHLQGVVPQLQQRTAGPLRILELGAGCGLLGLGLAATCHADVVMTESGSALDDGETSLSWLERNVELNREICEAGGGHVSCAKLAWGDSDDIAAVRARYAEGFDLVVGSDVLYDSTRFPELWTTVDAFAAANDHGATVDETADLDVIVPHAVGIFGYQIRNGEHSQRLRIKAALTRYVLASPHRCRGEVW